MTIWLKRAAAVGFFLAMSALVSAQWPKYPGGSPTPPTGPAPRTADGKPDLSGVWQNLRIPNGAAARGATPPPAPSLSLDQIADANFANAGAGFKDGLPLQPWAADLVKQRMADNSKDNPDARCLPMGFMQFHTHPQLRKIVQNPKVLIIMYEANYGLRQIFTDGRTLPKDPDPWWYGYSVGKWEGDTLVVETTGFADDTIWLDIRGDPLTSAAKVTERFRRPSYGNLEVEITVDDPKAYTRSWTVRARQRLVDTELNEFICEERDASHYVGARK
jgi:hypothetical protein